MSTHNAVNELQAAIRDHINTHDREPGLSDQAYAAQVLAEVLVLPLLVPDTRYAALAQLAQEKAQREAVAHLAEAEAEQAETMARLDAKVAERRAKLEGVTAPKEEADNEAAD